MWELFVEIIPDEFTFLFLRWCIGVRQYDEEEDEEEEEKNIENVQQNTTKQQ